MAWVLLKLIVNLLIVMKFKAMIVLTTGLLKGRKIIIPTRKVSYYFISYFYTLHLRYLSHVTHIHDINYFEFVYQTNIACENNNDDILASTSTNDKPKEAYTLHEYVKILFDMEYKINQLEKEYEETTNTEDKYKHFMNPAFVLYELSEYCILFNFKLLIKLLPSCNIIFI